MQLVQLDAQRLAHVTDDAVEHRAAERHVAHAAQAADALRVLGVTAATAAARQALQLRQAALVELDDTCRESMKHMHAITHDTHL